jgi:hypothetical protein
MSTAIRIEAENRWDALALTRKLHCYRWHLLQPDEQRWQVCLRVEGQTDLDMPDELLDVLQRWLTERRLPAALVHLPKGACIIGRCSVDVLDGTPILNRVHAA